MSRGSSRFSAIHERFVVTTRGPYRGADSIHDRIGQAGRTVLSLERTLTGTEQASFRCNPRLAAWQAGRWLDFPSPWLRRRPLG